MGNNTFYLVIVRNPIDNWRACLSYHQLNVEDTPKDTSRCFRLRKFIDRWIYHNSYYLLQDDIPVYVMRYEDMLIDAAASMEKLLRALPGEYPRVRARADIERVVRALGATKGRLKEVDTTGIDALSPFQVRCGKGFARLTSDYGKSELAYVTDVYGEALRRLATTSTLRPTDCSLPPFIVSFSFYGRAPKHDKVYI